MNFWISSFLVAFGLCVAGIGCYGTATVPVGEEVVLVGTGQSEIPVAVDEGSYRDLRAAMEGNDANLFDELLQAQVVFLVASGTAGRVVESGRLRYRIRLTDGEMENREGWVSASFVRRPAATT